MGERVIEADGKTYAERHPPNAGRGRALAAGELGLDMYGWRGRLIDLGVQDVDNAE